MRRVVDNKHIKIRQFQTGSDYQEGNKIGSRADGFPGRVARKMASELRSE